MGILYEFRVDFLALLLLHFVSNDVLLGQVSTRVSYSCSLQATVGTPCNTAPYITGSNKARLGHGFQNS